MNTTHYTDEELRQATEQGLITNEYHADSQHVIQELNRLRATEIASYLQYKQHAYMAVSLLSPGLKQDFQAHAEVELQHADQLGERVQQLGGIPLYTPAELGAKAAEEGVRPMQGATLQDMVIENLVLERRQVAAYTALIRELGDGDAQVGRERGDDGLHRRSIPIPAAPLLTRSTEFSYSRPVRSRRSGKASPRSEGGHGTCSSFANRK